MLEAVMNIVHIYICMYACMYTLTSLVTYVHGVLQFVVKHCFHHDHLYGLLISRKFEVVNVC